MLKMELIDDLYCPVVTCDWCGHRIEEATDGIVLWEWVTDVPSARLLTGAILFVHAACQRPFERGHDGPDRWGADELRYFPLYLAHNLKLDLTAVKPPAL